MRTIRIIAIIAIIATILVAAQPIPKSWYGIFLDHLDEREDSLGAYPDTTVTNGILDSLGAFPDTTVVWFTILRSQHLDSNFTFFGDTALAMHTDTVCFNGNLFAWGYSNPDSLWQELVGQTCTTPYDTIFIKMGNDTYRIGTN